MGMTRCGSRTFIDAADYRVSVPGASIELVVTGCGAFGARVSWVEMQSLRLVGIEESLPRVAFVALPAKSVFVSFPLDSGPAPLWCGVRLRRGDLVLHARGERFHQATDGATRWGLISMSRGDLAAYTKALLGRGLAVPRAARFLRPPSGVMADVLRLHVQACRMASANPGMLARREVARALEQDLIRTLIAALASAEVRERSEAMRRHAEIMVRFEKALAAHRHRQPPMPELCAALGVPERTLRMCCEEFVGRTPLGYARLRRLNLARAALSKAEHGTASVAKIARAHGFSEPGRFAVAYRALFGEAPSATLMRNSAESA
jgi:AraC-like DNA-binding protein